MKLYCLICEKPARHLFLGVSVCSNKKCRKKVVDVLEDRSIFSAFANAHAMVDEMHMAEHGHYPNEDHEHGDEPEHPKAPKKEKHGVSIYG